jgi:uncharacterized protein YndB with AHSA1/START domain
MSDVRTVTVERQLPFAPAKVWRALTQPHLMAEWLMQNDFVPAVGHRFQLRGEWGGVLDCAVLVIEPEKTLSYTWNHAHADAAYNLESVVTFTLKAADGGTHLKVEQAGFRPEQKQAFGGARAGWGQFLGKLDALLAREKS